MSQNTELPGGSYRASIKKSLDECEGNYFAFLNAGMPATEGTIPARRIAAARELLASETDAARKAALHLLLARIFSKKGDFDSAAKEAAPLVEDASLELSLRALAARFLGQSREAKGEHKQAEKLYGRGLELCGSKYPEISAAICNMLGQVYYYQTRYEQALEYFERYKAHVEKTGDEHAFGIALNNVAIAHIGLGNAQEAENAYKAIIEKENKNRNSNSAAVALSNLSGLMLLMNRSDMSLAYADRTFEILRNVENVFIVTITSVYKADALFRLGRLDEAEKTCAQAVFFAKTNQRKYIYPCAKSVEGKILAARGKASEAKKSFEESIANFREFLPGGAPEDMEFALLEYGKLLLSEGNPKGAEAVAEALKILKSRAKWPYFEIKKVEAEKLLAAASGKSSRSITTRREKK